MMVVDMMMQFGSVIATVAFTWVVYRDYLPEQLHDFIRSSVPRYAEKLVRFFSPYQDITFDEYTGGEFSDRSEIYSAIETYISENSASMARRMKGNFLHGKSLLLSIADREEVTDEYKGVKVWWSSNKTVSHSYTISYYPGSEEKRFYRLSFHGRHRELITTSYLKYVLEEGEAIKIRKRTRKLYTNAKEDSESYVRKSNMWSHVEFKHASRFETLAMDPQKKQKIIEDLRWFSNAKAYYERIGKAWKRGYLLCGPPGTGKSTMVAAMANLLEYDIYDLELTTVKDNVELRKLLIETTSKSIILIEDIDCSLDLTGQRKEGENEDEEKVGDGKDVAKKLLKDTKKKKGSEVTLSGLLNFIDGVWSAHAGERIIVFTTNYVDKLDPALIRRGRMDMRIEMGYCCFDSFKVLARNYLEIEAHPLFGAIERLLGETKMTPADVAEHLMPKSCDVDVDGCLESLVAALEVARDDVKVEEEKLKKKIVKEERNAERKGEEEVE